MKLNKGALLDVVKFWTTIFGIFGYAFLIACLATKYGAVWLAIGASLPALIVFSMIIYAGSGAHDSEWRKDEK